MGSDRTLLLTISFDGSGYCGWQVQKNGLAVMEVLQNTIEEVLNTRPDIKGCSRTDSGVHALRFCVSFVTDRDIPCDRLLIALNCRLPDDIAAVDCCEVTEGFHARYDAISKSYEYHVLNSKYRSPFLSKRALHVPFPIDAEALQAEASAFVGRHDFNAFCNAGSKITDTVRTVYSFNVERRGDLVIFSVCGDGFLYNMVRIMVGTLLDIHRGVRQEGSIPHILESKTRKRAGVTAPAWGLYLQQVNYDEKLFK